MRTGVDAYRRELDRIFQDLSDRESLARKKELLEALAGHGIDVPEVRRILRHVGRQKHKSQQQLEGWVEAKLARLVKLLDDSDSS